MELAIVAGGLIGLILYLRYSLAVPACVLEDLKASDAIKALEARSKRQQRKRRP